MSKMLPRGQPALCRQGMVSGSSKVDKGAPSCVPPGSPGHGALSPVMEAMEQAWLFRMGCPKLLQVNLKAR